VANYKPYFTSDSLIEFIKLSMALPIDQSTYSYNDILKLANQELQNAAVPALKAMHEEYFVYKVIIPLVANIGVYPIPNRASGMALRDIKYVDSNGNFFDMVRIAPEDKAFFGNNTGTNQVVTQYYLEGNNIVLSPVTMINPTGSLSISFNLRPNYLVRNDRVCTIQNFVKTITITNYLDILVGDKVVITTNNQTTTPTTYTFTATASTTSSTQFAIGASNNATAINLNTAMTAAGLTTSLLLNVISNTYSDISRSFSTVKSTTGVALTGIIDIDTTYLYIQFDQLPTSYTEIDTQVTETLFSNGCLVDFLQTLPGHKIIISVFISPNDTICYSAVNW